MNISQQIARLLQLGIAALGAWLVSHGAMSPEVSAQVAQIVGGIVLIGLSLGFHLLRVWIDAHDPALAPIVDPIDDALAKQAAADQAKAKLSESQMDLAAKKGLKR